MRTIQKTPAPPTIISSAGGADEPPQQADREASIPSRKSGSDPAVQTSNLGARELDVLRCLAKGQSRRKIASSLFISPATVHTHLKNIYIKLDAHNSIEAINEARRLQLID